MDDDLETTETMFDLIPEDVQHYIYSDTFDEKLKELFMSLGLNEEHQKEFKGMIFEFMAQLVDQDEMEDFIESLPIDEFGQKKIQDWIGTNIVTPVINIMDVANTIGDDEDEVEGSTAPEQPVASNNATSLTSLADRLKLASITAPVKRDYGIENTAPAGAAPKAIDPYHEAIDNE